MTTEHGEISNRKFRSSGGFTFVEILAAMLFMAIVIPAAVQGIAIANRAGVAAERKRMAAELVYTKLSEMILTEEWRNGDQEGNFDELLDDGGLNYRWTLESNAWEEDTMRVITLRVFYKVQDREYSVSLYTLEKEEAETEE